MPAILGNAGPQECKISTGTKEWGMRKFRNANFRIPGVLSSQYSSKNNHLFIIWKIIFFFYDD